MEELSPRSEVRNRGTGSQLFLSPSVLRAFVVNPRSRDFGPRTPDFGLHRSHLGKKSGLKSSPLANLVSPAKRWTTQRTSQIVSSSEPSRRASAAEEIRTIVRTRRCRNCQCDQGFLLSRQEVRFQDVPDLSPGQLQIQRSPGKRPKDSRRPFHLEETGDLSE